MSNEQIIKADVMQRDIQLIEVRSELGAGTRGASLGVDALRVSALNAGSNYFKAYPSVEIPHENHLLFDEDAYPFAHHIDGIARAYERICDEVKSSLEEGKWPLVLSGDHSSAGGTIAGVKAAYPDKTLGVIWIDAHGDLHTPYTSPSGNVHGMPLGATLGIDALEGLARNEVDRPTQALWEALKQTGGVTPKLDPKHLVQIAVRDTEKEEDALCKRLGIKNFTVEEVREQGVVEIVEAIRSRLAACDIIYITFDVDSLDCNLVSHGTGTPVPNGLTPEEANMLLQTLVQDERVKCLEFCEINPTLDEKKNKMSDVAFDILEQTTAVLNRRLKSVTA